MIGRKIIIQFLGVGSTSILGFLTLSLSARFFGPEILGEVNYYLGILGIMLLFSDLGFSRAHVKFTADKKNLSKKIGVFLSIKFVLLTLFLVASFCYFYFFLKENSSLVKSFAFLILLLYEYFNRLGCSLLITFEGLLMVTVENLVLGIGKLTRLIGLVLLLLLAKDLIGLSLSYLLEGALILLLAGLSARRFLPLSWSKNIFKKYFSYSMPFFVIYPLSYIQGNADVIILRNFWSASFVGYYSAAIGMTAFLKTLYGVLISLFFPKMSQLFAKKQFKKIQEYTDMAVRYLMIIFVPIFLNLHFVRKEIIHLILGSSYGPAIPIFSFSILAIFILMLSSPYDHLLYAAGKHQIMSPITIFSVFSSIALQLLLVPRSLFSIKLFGLAAQGTIIANIIVWFITLWIQIFLVFKLLRIRYYFIKKANQGLFFLCFVLASLLSYYFLNFESQTITFKLLFLIADNLAFYLLLKYFKIIKSEDIKYLKLVLAPRKIVKEGLLELKKNDKKN